MQDLKAPASGRYVAAHASGDRPLAQIRYVVVHSTEGDTAQGAAAWFANPASSGSANMVVDDNIAYRTLPDSVIPWAAPPRNGDGWHLEFAGYAHWSEDGWRYHKLMLRRGAYKAALRCKAYNIPVRWVGPIGLRLGRAGITTHNDISRTWHESTHTDPGPGFPKAYWLELVKSYLAELQQAN